MNRRFYFAYGSNCNLGQMAYRCPKARRMGAATLPNFRLTFNGRRDGSGVANILPCTGAAVTGLLWEITTRCELSLDRYEGFPYLYEKKNVTVRMQNGEQYEAMVYVMTPAYRDPALPGRDYLEGIVEGFQENGMDPEPVWAAVRATEADRKSVV